MTHLTPEQFDLLTRCIHAVADDMNEVPDWESRVLLGPDKTQFLNLASAWPAVDMDDEEVWYAVHFALAMLLSFPKEQWDHPGLSQDQVLTLVHLWNQRNPDADSDCTLNWLLEEMGWLPQKGHLH